MPTGALPGWLLGVVVEPVVGGFGVVEGGWGFPARFSASCTALAALMRPYPNLTDCPLEYSLGEPTLSDVIINICFTSRAVKFGLADNIKAHMPATRGVALDVPPKC